MQKFNTQNFTHNYEFSALFPSFRAKKKNKTFRQLNPFLSSRKKGGGGGTELGSTQTALFKSRQQLFPSDPA